MILHYLKVGWRNLLKYKVSASIGIIGLAVGLLCFVLCTYCARLLIEVDQDFPEHERIAEVLIKDAEGRYFSGTPAGTTKILEDKFPGKTECFTAVTYPWKLNATFELSKGKTVDCIINWIEIDHNFKKVFSCRLIAGNWEQIDRQKNAIVLSETAARRIYGKENPLGKVIHPNEFEDYSIRKAHTLGELKGDEYTIGGIMEDLPLNASFSFLHPVDALIVNDEKGIFATQNITDGHTGCNTYALLRSEVTCKDINQEVDIKKHAIVLGNEDWGIFVPDFLPSGQNHRNSYKGFSGLYLGLGSLILLVALLNFFMFLVGNFVNRLKEYHIRKGLGGGYKQLFGLLYTETLLYVIPVVVLVLCLLELVYNRLDLGFGGRSLIFKIGILYRQLLEYLGWGIILCAFICGMLSLWLSRKYIRGELRNSSRSSKQWVRNGMLGLQLVICCVFLTSSLAIYNQLTKVNEVFFPGLSKEEKENILEVQLDAPQLKGREVFLIDQLSRFPEVAEVLQADLPLLSVRDRGMAVEGEAYLEYRVLRVGKNFMTFLHMPLQGGVVFQFPGQGVADPGIMKWIGKEPLGKQLENVEGQGFEVCGLTESFPGVYEEGTSATIWTLGKHPAVCYLKVHPEKREVVLKKIAALLNEWVPASVLPPVKTLQQLIKEETDFFNKIQVMLFFLAMVCIVITILGIYSAITIDTERRRKEMAIRKINGASGWQIAGLFGKLYLKLLAITVIITFPLLSWGIRKWLETFTIRFDFGIGFWLTVILVLLLVIILTIAWKIREITLMNPVEELKDE